MRNDKADNPAALFWGFSGFDELDSCLAPRRGDERSDKDAHHSATTHQSVADRGTEASSGGSAGCNHLPANDFT
jgi:hypothetical protein